MVRFAVFWFGACGIDWLIALGFRACFGLFCVDRLKFVSFDVCLVYKFGFDELRFGAFWLGNDLDSWFDFCALMRWIGV